VFVVSAEHGDTRRITNTPEQERSVSFSPDGRTLLYASERGNSWKIYRTDLTDKDEPNFFNATGFKETPVVESNAEAFQPHFSPDGAEIAYLEERTTLKVLNLKTGKTRTVLAGNLNYSYEDGDQYYEWSPDGRWFSVQFLSPGRWSSEVGVIPSSGDGKLVNISQSGYEDEKPYWARKGEVLFWRTDRQGLRSQAGQPSETDVYAAFLTRSAWDRYQLDEAAYDQLTEKEKKTEDKGKAGAEMAGDALSPDGETLYSLAKYDKGFDLWKYTQRKKEIKLVAAFGAREAGLKLDPKGKKAFVLHDGKLSMVDLDSDEASSVDASAKMDLDESAERAYMFEHIWRQTE